MRFGVVANIQANLPALQAVLTAIDGDDRQVERVVCSGDLVGLGPYPNEVIDLLLERDIESVRGNYDDALAFDRLSTGMDFATEAAETVDRLAVEWTRRALTTESLEYLRGLAADLRLAPGPGVGGVKVKANAHESAADEYRKSFLVRSLMGGLARPGVRSSKRVVVVHGTTRGLNEFVRESTANSILASVGREANCDVMITGHSEEVFRRDAGGIVFIGAGAVSRRRGNLEHADFAIVDVTSDGVEVEFSSAPYDREAYNAAVITRGLPQTPAAR